MISISEAQLAEWLSPILWPFLRVLSMFTAAPVLSSRAVPMRTKIGLAFLVALATAATMPSATVIGVNDPRALGVALQQIVVGVAIGFTVRVVFSAFELAGEVIGFQMGLNFASFFDPTMNSQSSAIARFFGQMVTLLFVVLNGHIMVLMAVNRSFVAFPMDGNFLSTLGSVKIYNLGADLFASALWIALPLIGVMLFANLALGIISRVAPQMNIFAVGFPITLVVGLIGIAVMLPMLDQPFLALMERSIELFGSN